MKKFKEFCRWVWNNKVTRTWFVLWGFMMGGFPWNDRNWICFSIWLSTAIGANFLCIKVALRSFRLAADRATDIDQLNFWRGEAIRTACEISAAISTNDPHKLPALNEAFINAMTRLGKEATTINAKWEARTK